MSCSVREYRSSQDSGSIAEDIAQEAEALAASGGRLAVVTSHPEQLTASVKQHWRAHIKRMEEQARMRMPRSQLALAEMTTRRTLMDSIIFSTWVHFADVPADATFGTLANFDTLMPECDVLYVAAPAAEEIADRLTQKMPSCSRVVIYTDA